MALTPSTMLELGTPAPEFSLPDYDGNIVTLNHRDKSAGTVVAFICNHCPYVIHLKSHFSELAREYIEKGVRFIAINSNDTNKYPADGREKMKLDAAQFEYPFPYLIDETQQVAHAFRAACTPDFFLFDQDLRLVYRGQYDDSRPGNGRAVTGSDLRAALDAVLSDETVSAQQKPSMGCNIKWKPGNEPDYFS